MLTALYDGNCVICQSTRRTITALDWLHRIVFVDMHDIEAWQLHFPDLKTERLMGEIHVIDSDGGVFAGLYATRRMLKELPLGLPLWLLLQAPGMDRLGVRCYRFIARNRYRINALLGNELSDCEDDSCKIPLKR